MNDPRAYLAQILESLDHIVTYTKAGREACMRESLIQDAVIRRVEIVGEAVKRVPDAYRQRHEEIRWRELAAFRDVLIHQYNRIDLERVWRIVESQLPRLRNAIASFLPPLEQLEREIAGEVEPPAG